MNSNSAALRLRLPRIHHRKLVVADRARRKSDERKLTVAGWRAAPVVIVTPET